MSTIVENLKSSRNDGNTLLAVRSLSDEDLMKLMVYMFNTGYHYGHHATVESNFIDVHRSDMEYYHSDVVDDVLNDR